MNRPLVYWGVAALAVAVIVGVVVFFQLPSPDTLPTRAQPTGVAPENSAPAPPQTASVETGQPSYPTTPEFDIVRVDETGNVVIAGRSQPDCKIMVREGNAIVGTATADRRGDWVVVPDGPLAPGDRELSLVATCGDSDPVESDRVVVLAVPESGGGALAVAVARDGSAPARVLQTPAREGASADGPPPDVTVAAVDYDDAGEVAVSGTAPPNSTVQVYVDDALIGRATTDAQGRWTLIPDQKVEPGAFNLRVDQVQPDGSVIARSQIPFVRGVPLDELPPGRVVIIKPGDYLWRIARQRYGAGLRYTLIYEANRDQIRDPDLIYPGQIFVVPTVN